MIKTAIIVNPKSGKGRGHKFISELNNYHIPSSIKLSTFITERPLHAVEIAKNISSEFDRIIIAGGDGTLNEFVNGFNLNSNAILGLLPIGSGNDFSNSLNKTGAEIYKSFNYFLSENPVVKKVDIGAIKLSDLNEKIINKKFINSLGIGFDARVAYLNQTNKILSGSLSYIISILRAFWVFDTIKFNLIFKKKLIKKTALFCSVGNGESVGAGLYLMPGAQINDGYLDLSIVTLRSRLKLLKLLPLAMRNEIKGIKELEQFRFKKLEIMLESPYYTHVDGEIVSSIAIRIKIEILESAISFMIMRE